MLIRSMFQGTRWLAVFALTCLVFWNPTLAGSGRDFSRCVQSCNEIRKACHDNCSTDCKSMFPKGSGRNDCVAQCKHLCVLESQTCKDICKANKDGVTPETP